MRSEEGPKVDEALATATTRTVEAQEELVRGLDDPEAVVRRAEKVERRADDLHVLAEEAEEEARDDD